MEWDATPETMEKLRNSIQPIQTELSLREVLAQDFPRDCSSLPITGGWGYTRDTAIIFVRDQFPRPSSPDFVDLEYHIAQKVIYEELIIFRPEHGAFSGINSDLKSQGLSEDGGRRFDCLNLEISCWNDQHWELLKRDWEENDLPNAAESDRRRHEEKRLQSQINYERQFWFDITDVFQRL